MNNKKLGMLFERKVCDILAERGCWVHFLSPDSRGAQPFDLIAVRNGLAIAADCKTCKDHIFRMTRVEDNQVLAFEKWLACENLEPGFFVEHNGAVYYVGYLELKKAGKVDLNERSPWCILK